MSQCPEDRHRLVKIDGNIISRVASVQRARPFTDCNWSEASEASKERSVDESEQTKREVTSDEEQQGKQSPDEQVHGSNGNDSREQIRLTTAQMVVSFLNVRMLNKSP